MTKRWRRPRSLIGAVALTIWLALVNVVPAAADVHPGPWPQYGPPAPVADQVIKRSK